MRRMWFLCVVALPLLASCSHGADKPRTAFNGDSALAYAREQFAFGPRIPGTAAHHAAGDWIIARMRERADTVIVQSWTHVTVKGDSLPLRNILARYRPAESQRVLYVTHWDTRPISDGAMDPARQKLPVPGANDGASGVGLFVALGDVLKRTPPDVGVDLLFVDGEDYGNFDKNEDVLLGSRWFADHLPSSGYAPLFGVLWDMIGDADLGIYEEGNSMQQAPEVVDRVWRQAADLGYGAYFIPQGKYTLTDDHVPLLAKGLRVIDVIDFDYQAQASACPGLRCYHHTPDDTMDKISAHSLQVVGDVALALVSGK